MDMRNFIGKALGICAMATMMIACSDDEAGRRVPGQNGGGDGEKTDVTFQVNTNWTISHSRKTVTELDGYKYDVDIISVDSRDNESYWLDVVTYDNLISWYNGDIVSYIKDEPNYYSGELYTGTCDITFDRMRSDKWYAIAFGMTSSGEPTGDYAVTFFTLDEETPTDAFKSWLGDWTLTGKSKTNSSETVTYNINVASADANFLFTVTGWETGSSCTNDMSAYSIEAQYDKYTNTMLFKSLFIETYTDESTNRNFDFCFYGNFDFEGASGMNAGSYTLTDNITIAEASIADDAKSAEVKGCGFDFIYNDKSYPETFASMQYFDLPYDSNDIYVYNENVPVFPLTMTKTATTKSANISTSGASNRVTKALRVKPMREPVGRHSQRSSSAVRTAR